MTKIFFGAACTLGVENSINPPKAAVRRKRKVCFMIIKV